MTIKNVFLEGFRNLPELDIPVSSTGLRIVGSNGAGKTSFLEALSYLGQGRSFRGAPDSVVSRDSRQGFSITAQLESLTNNPKTVSISWTYSAKTVSIDGTPLNRISELIGHVPMIILNVDTILLVRGNPEYRRRFMDAALSQQDPNYLRTLIDYRRVLRSRNTLIQSNNYSDLNIWDTQLVSLASILIDARTRFLTFIGERAARLLTLLTPAKHRLDIVYRPTLPPDNPHLMLQILEKRRSTDIRMGHTTVGPHRDDFSIQLNGRQAKATASLGESKSVAISIVSAQADWTCERRGSPPILLLDDLTAELDGHSIARLAEIIPPRAQIFITDTEITPLPPHLADLEPLYLDAGRYGPGGPSVGSTQPI